MSQIQIKSGKFDATCTTSASLIENQAKQPIIREIMEYVEQRSFATLITSGATSPWDLKIGNTKAAKTKIGQIPAGKLIGDNAYRYNIMGRIQEPSVINSLVSNDTTTGVFVLSMKDNMLYPGMNTKFYSDNFYARVMSAPTGSAGNFLYTFQSTDGTAFDWNAHVAPQQGEKLAFGAYTSYSEGSLRGYSRSFFPSTFINHLGIQRKALSITGSALSDVTWVEYGMAKGWMFHKEQQARIQMTLEDDHAKVNGVSTMKDPVTGALLTRSRQIDPETGFDIVFGDGLIPQIEGGNDMYASGPDGNATIEDYKDMMNMLEKKSNSTYGKRWYVVTGTDGYANAQEVLRDYWLNNLGGRTNSGPGDDIEVGGNFDRFKFAGNVLTFVKFVDWDNDKKWFERGSDGKLLRSKMNLILDAGEVGSNPNGSVNGGNIEILTKGAYGVNRSMVTTYLNGMTGLAGKTIFSPTDALSYEVLKEDGIFVYNTTSCGIIRSSAY